MHLIQTLDQFMDELYFGLLSHKPHSCIIDFLKEYVPTALPAEQPEVNWTAYPPYAEEPTYDIIQNTFTFKQHPLIDFTFTLGRLVFTQKTYQHPQWINNLLSIKLCFDFVNKGDAMYAFESCIKNFTKVSCNAKIDQQEEIKKATFSNEANNGFYDHVQIRIEVYTDQLAHINNMPYIMYIEPALDGMAQ